MPLYQKKPLIVNAVQYYLGIDHPAVKYASAYVGEDDYGQALWEVLGYIETIEGNLNLAPNCWIVGPGVKGEYWPVQDEIFKQTYELVK